MEDNDLPICTACGTQFSSEAGIPPSNCKICDDPRQFVPGKQTWTTLTKVMADHSNKWEQDPVDARVWSIWTEPKFAIGQRAFLIQTEQGNILWDMIALLDDETLRFIKSKGDLKAIVISHPHYYTTYVHWLRAFTCPIYVGADDQEWLCRSPPSAQSFSSIQGSAGATQPIVSGMTAIKTGGHFLSSLVLHWENKLFIADSIVTVPSAHTPHPRPSGQTSFVFQYSIPNSIPLPPWEILKIWHAIKPYYFDTTHGAFQGMDVRDKNLKARMLQSMKIQVRSEGWETHAMMSENLK